MSFKDKQLTLGVLSVKKIIKRFANVYEFCNRDINKFIFLLRKGVYPYEYIDSWKRFDETSLPDKKAFYSSLNTEKKYRC